MNCIMSRPNESAPDERRPALPKPQFEGSVVHVLLGTEGGGIITTIRQWAPLLLAAGWDLRFAALQESTACAMLRAAGIEPVIIQMSKFGRFTRLSRRLAPLRPAILHTHNPAAHLMALAARRRLRASVVRTVHAEMKHEMSGTLPPWKIALWTRLMEWAFPRTDLVTIVSPHLQDLLPGGRGSVEAMFIPNSFDPAPIERDGSELDPEIAAWLGTAPLVLAMGRLVTVKNYPLLVGAWVAVSQQHPNARLIIAGSGPKEAELNDLVNSLGIAGCVRIQPWVAATAPLLKRASIVAISSSSECYPMLAFEAMAAGKPVVSTRLPGLQVEDGRTAMLAAHDPVALAQAICHLLEYPDLAMRLGNAARRDLDERFRPWDAAARIAVAYNRLRAIGPTPEL